ncbi:MAG: hypothetical protein ABI358_09885 [Ginsengibacter sp.]
MKNKYSYPFKLLSLILFTSITCLFSCSSNRYIYSASTPNNPYFTKKGQSKLTGYYSSSSEDLLTNKYADGWDLQGAYAIDKHWALTAAYFNRREKDVYNQDDYNGPFDSSVITYRRNLFEFGGGYFIPLNAKKTITFNFFGGMAFGKFSFNDNGLDGNMANYSRYHTSHISKWFFQPSINFMPGRYVRISFTLKSSYVHYGNIRTSYSATELQYFSLDNLANRTLNFIEPAWDFQFGLPKFPWVKLDMAVSGVSSPPIHQLDVRANNTSIGLSFDFSKMGKSK